MITIDRALSDHQLLGAAIGDPASWATWRVALRAAFGIELNTDEERKIFEEIAGNRAPPTNRVSELWVSAGRRGGKSRMAAAIGCFLACFSPRKKLAAGETGEVTIIAASRSQAVIIYRYALGFLQASPVLQKEIENVTATEVRLRGNIVLSTRAGSYRTVRGRTLLAAIIDEVAFLRDETSATPDVETYRALLPALATTGGMMVGISTPYRRAGLLYQKHRDCYGVDNPDVLVIAGSSQLFNPTIDVSVIDRARASDPEAARAEWDAIFRSDLAAYLDDATIDFATNHARPMELPPIPGVFYKAFTDASGGRHDAYTLAIAHRAQDGRYVVDVCTGVSPPFDPKEVTQQFADLLRTYKIFTVNGDSYGQEWVQGAWRSAGIHYVRSELPKSQLYLESLPLWSRGLVSIPNHTRLLRELRLLERHTHRSGRDTVDHGRSGTDDFANSVAGVLRYLSNHLGYDILGNAFSTEDQPTNKVDADIAGVWRRTFSIVPAGASTRHTERSRQMADDNWQGGPCRGPIEGQAWHETLQARDRQVIEEGKALQRYYESLEADAERQRLAKIQEQKDWQQRWYAYRFFGGPKPKPLDME
jgi:hypothetical protein